MRALPDFEVIERPAAGGAIALAGPPGRLRGEVRLRNPGSEQVVVREAALARLPGPAATVEGATTGPVTARMTAILRPGEGARAPITVALDPRTPPGEYQAELTLGPHTYPLEILVTEVIDLEIVPSTLVVTAPPGGRVTQAVVFRNRGNRPLEIGEIGALPLDDERLSCRFLRATLAEAGDRIEGVDHLVSELARQAKIAVERPGKLRVHNPEPCVLAPGEARTARLTIRMPEGVDHHSRYFAHASIYNADLDFVLLPAPGRAEPEDRPRLPKAAKAEKTGKTPARAGRPRT